MNNKDEYITIRSEMLQRFDRIHDILKFLITFYVAFLSFYFIQSNFSNFIAIIIPLLIISILGIWIIPIYKSIFNQGSYISIIIEDGKNFKFHKMNRNSSYYLNKKENKNKYSSKNPIINFISGKYWAEDSKQFAKILILLLLIGILFVCYKIYLQHPKIVEYIKNISYLKSKIIIILFFVFIDSHIIFTLCFMRNYRKKNEVFWKEYKNYFNEKYDIENNEWKK